MRSNSVTVDISIQTRFTQIAQTFKRTHDVKEKSSTEFAQNTGSRHPDKSIRSAHKSKIAIGERCELIYLFKQND